MYYPILRGKQEELLAIRELVEVDKLHTNIVPIIEPVTLSPTLVSTLKVLVEKNRDIYLIKNPTVGDFDDDMSIQGDPDEAEDDNEKRRLERLIKYREELSGIISAPNIHPALYVSNDYKNAYHDAISEGKGSIAAISTDEGETMTYVGFPSEVKNNITLCFVPEYGFGTSIDEPLVLIKDRFNKCSSNARYAEKDDEFFSRDHLTFSPQNYEGFADYSMIGKEYAGPGFTPYAIALHIVYHEPGKKDLWIRHFVSDTNYSNRNPALKFSEAMEKLAEWSQQYPHISTIGLSSLIELYSSARYPGLGKLKRYSIMHHLELVGRLI